jgi:hypothetical protein
MAGRCSVISGAVRRGEKGDKGERGTDAPTITNWHADSERYSITPFFSNRADGTGAGASPGTQGRARRRLPDGSTAICVLLPRVARLPHVGLNRVPSVCSRCSSLGTHVHIGEHDRETGGRLLGSQTYIYRWTGRAAKASAALSWRAAR